MRRDYMKIWSRLKANHAREADRFDERYGKPREIRARNSAHLALLVFRDQVQVGRGIFLLIVTNPWHIVFLSALITGLVLTVLIETFHY